MSVNSNLITRNNVVLECHSLKPKLTLGKFSIQLSILERFENYSKMTSMIPLIPQINHYFINKYDNKYSKIRLKNSIHDVHDCCRSISQAKRHNKKLIMTITGPQCCFRDATLCYSQLTIARSEVYLRKTSGTMKLIRKHPFSEKELKFEIFIYIF